MKHYLHEPSDFFWGRSQGGRYAATRAWLKRVGVKAKLRLVQRQKWMRYIIKLQLGLGYFMIIVLNLFVWLLLIHRNYADVSQLTVHFRCWISGEKRHCEKLAKSKINIICLNTLILSYKIQFGYFRARWDQLHSAPVVNHRTNWGKSWVMGVPQASWMVCISWHIPSNGWELGVALNHFGNLHKWVKWW